MLSFQPKGPILVLFKSNYKKENDYHYLQVMALVNRKRTCCVCPFSPKFRLMNSVLQPTLNFLKQCFSVSGCWQAAKIKPNSVKLHLNFPLSLWLKSAYEVT